VSGPDDSGPFEPGTDPCNQALEELYHFLQGELTEERRVTIRVHLDGCSSCLEVYDFEAELREVVAERCSEQVPDDLRKRIAGFLGLDEAH
jgi:mycothiol system anti-sigma-R factor